MLDDDKSDDNINVQTVDDNRDVTDDNDDKMSSDVKCDDFATSSDDSVASRDELINEQRAVPNLNGCFELAERNRAGIVMKDELLYHRAHRRSLVLAFAGAMASAVARAYNGGLGAVPPAGSRAEPLVRGSGGKAPRS